MQLPQAFQEKMKKLLPAAEGRDFFTSYDCPAHAGLRVNTLKISVEQFLRLWPFPLEPIPWTTTGFYYARQDRPAKHAYYHAGLFYLQEPSAMAPAACLAPEPGERVLDLCAAPGGKTTQLAAAMQGRGILVANDLAADRAKALVKNLELAGVRNAVVTNETPERLAKYFAAYFDRVLVDAPCSGEGMFRRDAGVMTAWREQANPVYARTQRQILRAAAEMVRPGGRLLYSTCTFDPRENERVIGEFLREQAAFSLIDIPKEHGFMPGLQEDDCEVSAVARLWPHRLKGKGHFLALLTRKGVAEKEEPGPTGPLRTQGKLNLKTFGEFTAQTLPGVAFTGIFLAYGEHLYVQPEGVPALAGLKVVRPGFYLGQLKKHHFAPSQALAMGLKAEQAPNRISFRAGDEAVGRYLKAETVAATAAKGWVLVCVDGFPLGWAKGTAEGLKNYYPIAWRRVD